MTYEELHRRYGTHVSQRIRRELSPSDFASVEIDSLPEWLVRPRPKPPMKNIFAF